MRQFSYERPAHAADALRLAAAPDTRYLGGGTNLVDLMRLGVETPSQIVDLAALPYDFVTDAADDALRIGAGVRNSALAAHPTVRSHYPVLSQALLAGACGQLRNRATVGGNLVQRTRCRYFQDLSKPCNKRAPGSGCPARSGEHHNLAILGASEHCIATHPSDMAVALTALDAVVHVQDAQGPSQIPLSEFYVLPGDTPERETTLRPGAIITAVGLPWLPFAERSCYRKVRERASFAFAIGSVAAALDLDGEVVRDLRIALGAVAPTPWRAHRAEAAARGRPATEATFRLAAEAELAAAQPLRDNGYKVPLLTNLIVQTLLELSGESGS